MPKALESKPKYNVFLDPYIKAFTILIKRKSGTRISVREIIDYCFLIGESDHLFFFEVIDIVENNFLKMLESEKDQVLPNGN